MALVPFKTIDFTPTVPGTVQSVTAASPTPFDATSANAVFPVRPGGPYLISGGTTPGNSMIVNGIIASDKTYGRTTLSGQALTGVQAKASIYIMVDNDQAGETVALGLTDSAGGFGRLIGGLGMKAGKLIYLTQNLNDSPVIVEIMNTPMYQWIDLYVVKLTTSSNVHTFKFYYKLTTDSEPVLAGTVTGVNTYNTVTYVNVGCSMKAGGGNWHGRVGGIEISSITSLSDYAPSTLWTSPPNTITWHWKAGASANGDGLTELTAWDTADRVMSELQGYGVFHRNVPTGTGDLLQLDSNVELTDTGYIDLAARGMKFDDKGYEIKVARTVTTWTNVSGEIYSTTECKGRSLVWEGMGNEAGNYLSTWFFTKWGATLPALARGQCWTNDSDVSPILYIRCWDGSNPSTNGRTYYTSRYYPTSAQSSPLSINNVYVECNIDGHCWGAGDQGNNYNVSAARAGGGYLCSFGSNISIGGTDHAGADVLLTGNGWLTHATKHIFGVLTANRNMTYNITGNLKIEQCLYIDTLTEVETPSQTNIVFFHTSPSTGNYANITGARILYGAPDPTNGTFNQDTANPRWTGTWFTHGNDTDGFTEMTINNCEVGLSISSGGLDTTCPLYINDTLVHGNITGNNMASLRSGGIIVSYIPLHATRCRVVSGPINPYGGGSKTDCVETHDFNVNSYQAYTLSGTQTWTNCTVDASLATSNSGNQPLFVFADACKPIITGCVFICPESTSPADREIGIFRRVATLHADSSFTKNTYVLNTNDNGFWLDNVTWKTYTQWKALGANYDSTSQQKTNSELLLRTSLRPSHLSPLVNFATERVSSSDVTGEVFLSRKTAGAYEYWDESLITSLVTTPIYVDVTFNRNIDSVLDIGTGFSITKNGVNNPITIAYSVSDHVVRITPQNEFEYGDTVNVIYTSGNLFLDFNDYVNSFTSVTTVTLPEPATTSILDELVYSGLGNHVILIKEYPLTKPHLFINGVEYPVNFRELSPSVIYNVEPYNINGPLTCYFTSDYNDSGIRFIIDDGNPDFQSEIYTAPFTLYYNNNNEITIKAKTFYNGNNITFSGMTSDLGVWKIRII